MQDKPDYYYRQSAVVPYLKESGTLKVILITTQKKKKWTLPKGIVDPGLSPRQSALKEAFEEAGIKGNIGEAPYDHFTYDKWGGTCDVQVYLMEVTGMMNTWPEADQRERSVVGACQAPDLVGRREIKPVLEKFCRERKLLL